MTCTYPTLPWTLNLYYIYISYTHSGTSTSTSSMQALPACQSHNKVDTYLPNLHLFHTIGLDISIGILTPNSVNHWTSAPAQQTKDPHITNEDNKDIEQNVMSLFYVHIMVGAYSIPDYWNSYTALRSVPNNMGLKKRNVRKEWKKGINELELKELLFLPFLFPMPRTLTFMWLRKENISWLCLIGIQSDDAEPNHTW